MRNSNAPSYSLFFVFLFTFALVDHVRPQGPPAVPVVTTTARRTTLAATAEFVGSTRPFRRSRLGAEIAGAISRFDLREGALVKKDEIIAELNRDIAKVEIEIQSAKTEAAASMLAELEAGTRAEEIERTEFEFDEAKRVVARMNERLEQMKTQAKSGAATEDELLDAEMNLDLARIRQGRTDAALRLARAGARAEAIATAKARLEEEKANGRLLAEQDKKRTIRAPFNGEVAMTHTQVGEWLALGAPVVEIVDLSRIEVVVPLPQRYVGIVKKGSAAKIRFDALHDVPPLAAVVDRIGSQADERGRTFPVYILLDNADGRWRAGLSAQVELEIEPPKDALAVPADCIYSAQGIDFVCVVENDVVRRAPVKLGTRAAGMVAVEGPLGDGARIIIRGNERVFPGQRVVEAAPAGDGDKK